MRRGASWAAAVTAAAAAEHAQLTGGSAQLASDSTCWPGFLALQVPASDFGLPVVRIL
jgi:hypothetical protein